MPNSSFLSGNEILIYVLILINILVCTGLYFFITTTAKKKLKKSIKQMTTQLEGIYKEPKESIAIIADENLTEFCKTVEELRSHLQSKENARQEMLEVINSIAINIEFDKLLSNILPKLMELTGSIASAFYMTNLATNKLEIKHSYGFSKNVYSEFDLNLGEGFVGLAVSSKQIQVVKDIPEDTIYFVKTIIGKLKPKSLMMVPIYNSDRPVGLLVFASIYTYSDSLLGTMELIKYYLGVALDNSLTYEKTKRLTSELKFQNKLIQNLNDDLEKKIQDRILYMNSLINSIKDYAIYAMDKNGIIMYWNTGAELLLGYKSEEVVGKNINIIHPDEDVQSGKIQQRLESVLKTGYYTENGWRLKKDGTVCYLEMSLFSIQNDREEIFGITNVTRDITNLKNMESSLYFASTTKGLLFDSFTKPLLILKRDGTIEEANKEAHAFLKTPSLKGLSLYSFFTQSENLKSELEKAFIQHQERPTRQEGFTKINDNFKPITQENAVHLKVFVMHDTILEKSRMVLNFEP